MKTFLLFIALTASLTTQADSKSHVFTSQPTSATVVELFTSQGCSSCPTAERWLSGIKGSKRLWHDIVPLAFHVDYWDDLGWKDTFSSAEYSLRQRHYKTTGHLASVYTPGIVINGNEWRGFFDPIARNNPLPRFHYEPGILVLSQSGENWQLQFKGDPARKLVAHVAWLGMNIESHISRGENAGKILAQDFVVLKTVSQSGKEQWTFKAFSPPDNASAIAAWISAPNDPAPIQAVGGEL